MASRLRTVQCIHMVPDTAGGAQTVSYTATLGFQVIDILLHTIAADGGNLATIDFNRNAAQLTAQLTTFRTANALGRATTIVNAQKTFAVGDVINMILAAGDGATNGEAFVYLVPNTANASVSQ